MKTGCTSPLADRSPGRMGPRARALALALCLAAGSAIGPAAAGAPPWPEAPYSYFANNAPLESVLTEFAASFSLSLALQPGVTGQVNGRFTTGNPTDFIARLGGVYGFSWFTHAGTLHVSKASDVVTRSIPVPGASQGNLRQALTDLGVLQPRFGWGELPDQGVVLVSGPPAYVSLLDSTLRQLPPGASAQQVMVFRLRHASAEDRVIMYRDRQINQPGLASVLRDLIAGRAAQGAGGLPAADAGPSGAAGGASLVWPVPRRTPQAQARARRPAWAPRVMPPARAPAAVRVSARASPAWVAAGGPRSAWRRQARSSLIPD